jgi:serine/threonine protein kinase
MAEVDVAPAPVADEEDGSRDVSVSASTSSLSDELATVRPPASLELSLDDEAPDTVRRHIEPGPEAIGGARRESGVQAVTRGGSSLGHGGDAAPGAESPSPESASSESPSSEQSTGVAATLAPPAGAGVAAVVEARSEEPAQPEPATATALADEGLPPPVEAGDSVVVVADVPVEAERTAEGVAVAQVEPDPGSDAVAASHAAAVEVSAAGEAAPADAAAPPHDDASHEVPPGWIEEGASDDEPALSFIAAGAPEPQQAAVALTPTDEEGDVVEEVQASWFEQGAELEERELAAAGSANGVTSAALDPDEITAGWIEEGEHGERTTPNVPLPGVREPRQPWVDDEADPVTPHDRGRPSSVQNADLPLADDLRGRVLANRFLAEEIAEQSAASITYSAYHLALDSPVTVQVLPRGLACFGEAAERVRQTAVSASMIGSAHIARTIDFGVFGSKDPGFAGGWPYWVAEHVEGKSLARLLNEESKLVLRRVLALGKQLASGLAAAHAAGIVHGHLKPDCLIVVEPGSRAEVVRILGFGLMHAAGGQLAPPSSSVFGVPFYVSPEQAACRPCDERTDIYALGAILYELMTGRPPFTGGDFAAVLCQHLDDDAESPSQLLDLTTGIARGLDEIILRCLAKDPEQRFASAAELVQELVSLETTLGSNKRRPMPEVARPTATIHSPAPRAESHASPSPKVIVSAELEAEAMPAAVAGATTPDEAAALQNPALPEEPAAGSVRSSTPPPPAAAGPDEGSGWWGRLIGRVSNTVRRPS